MRNLAPLIFISFPYPRYGSISANIYRKDNVHVLVYTCGLTSTCRPTTTLLKHFLQLSTLNPTLSQIMAFLEHILCSHAQNVPQNEDESIRLNLMIKPRMHFPPLYEISYKNASLAYPYQVHSRLCYFFFLLIIGPVYLDVHSLESAYLADTPLSSQNIVLSLC